MQKYKQIISSIIIFTVIISLKVFIEQGDNSFSKNIRERIHLVKGLSVYITDQKITPENTYFYKDSTYFIKKVIRDKTATRILLANSFNDQKNWIDFQSIKYPKNIFYSNKYCRIKTEKIPNNQKTVFFTENKTYPYVSKKDFFVVLDQKRNQVKLKKEQIKI